MYGSRVKIVTKVETRNDRFWAESTWIKRRYTRGWTNKESSFAYWWDSLCCRQNVLGYVSEFYLGYQKFIIYVARITDFGNQVKMLECTSACRFFVTSNDDIAVINCRCAYFSRRMIAAQRCLTITTLALKECSCRIGLLRRLTWRTSRTYIELCRRRREFLSSVRSESAPCTSL